MSEQERSGLLTVFAEQMGISTTFLKRKIFDSDPLIMRSFDEIRSALQDTSDDKRIHHITIDAQLDGKSKRLKVNHYGILGNMIRRNLGPSNDVNAFNKVCKMDASVDRVGGSDVPIPDEVTRKSQVAVEPGEDHVMLLHVYKDPDQSAHLTPDGIYEYVDEDKQSIVVVPVQAGAPVPVDLGTPVIEAISGNGRQGIVKRISIYNIPELQTLSTLDEQEDTVVPYKGPKYDLYFPSERHLYKAVLIWRKFPVVGENETDDDIWS